MEAYRDTSMSKYDDHDPELALRPRRPVEELPLFAQAPPAGTEQRQLPLPGTIAERYAAWRQTEDGQRAWAWIAERAIGEVARGATRLSAKGLVEACRHDLHIRINNIATPYIARELEDTYDITRGLFELRRRTAA